MQYLTGQLILLLGHTIGSIRIMALGMFIFGIAVSPLAVVQETIIVRFFRSHGLGVSLALGLLAGKGASFLSARTAYPLSAHFGPRAPFFVAAGLATFSFVVNLLYVAASRWLVDGACADLEAVDVEEEAKRRWSIDITEAQALEKVAAKKQESKDFEILLKKKARGVGNIVGKNVPVSQTEVRKTKSPMTSHAQGA